MKKKISLILVFLIFTSCGSGFSLQKKKAGDEFLVEKKSPLVLPPEYGKLPLPDGQESTLDQDDEISFKEVLTKNDLKKTELNQKSQNSIEKSILDKIK
jgi:hypothetical protein